MIDPFLARAIAAVVGLSIVAAPLGAVVVWSRMAYFGETIAEASLLGVALALAMNASVTAGVLAAALASAALIIFLSRQSAVPLDSVLGLLHYGALAAGVVATTALGGPSVDLMGYLFGDVLAVTSADLLLIYGGGAVVLAAVWHLWDPLLRLAVHDELAAAEGINPKRIRGLFVLLLAIVIALAVKIAGILLAVAFLIVPVAAARSWAATPERMVLIAIAVGLASSLAGLALSFRFDVPAGPAIVLVMSVLAGLSLARTGVDGGR